MNYAKENNILLEINEKDQYYGQYPLLYAIMNKGIEVVKLLMNYAKKK